MQIEAHVVPLQVVARGGLLIVSHVERAVVVVGRVVAGRPVVLHIAGHGASRSHGVELVDFIEDAVVLCLQLVGVHELTDNPIAHLVAASSEDLGNDGLVADTRNEHGLFGVVVVQIDKSRQLQVVVGLIVQSDSGIGVIDLVGTLGCIDQCQRVAHVVVGREGDGVHLPYIILGIRAQYRAIGLLGESTNLRHAAIGCHQRVHLRTHAYVLQVAGDIGQTYVGCDVYLTAYHHVATDKRMIAVAAGVAERSPVASVAEGDVVLGDFITSFYAEDVFCLEAILLDFLHPVGVFIEEIAVVILSVGNEGIVGGKGGERRVDTHADVAQVVTILGCVEHGKRRVLQVQTILATEGDAGLQVVARCLLRLNHDHAVAA